jgi:hypothetical protein
MPADDYVDEPMFVAAYAPSGARLLLHDAEGRMDLFMRKGDAADIG